MASRDRLERALINADKAGDAEAARALALALKNGQYDEPEEGGFLEGAANVANEAMAAVNRGAIDTVDFLGTPVRYAVNAIQQGTLNPREGFEGAAINPLRYEMSKTPVSVEGNYMEDGLAKDAIRAGGELVGPGVAAGGTLRQAAQSLPGMASKGESVAQGVLRQMGDTKAAQDAGYSALSGAGSVLGGEAGEAVGGDTGRQVGEFAGALGAPTAVALAKPAAAEGARRAIRWDNQKGMADAVEDFAEIGRVPTLGQANGEGIRQGLENLSARLFGGAPVRRAIEQTSDAMQSRIRAIADDITSVKGDVEAGRVIQRGITGDDGFVRRFSDRSSNLWRVVDKKIGPDAKSDISATKDTLSALVRSDGFAKMLNNPKLSQLKQVVDSTMGRTRINNTNMIPETVNTIPYRDLKALRTSIGEMLSSKELVSDVPRAQLKRLYASLSDDTRRVAEGAGAIDQFNRANNFTRSGHKRIDDFVERVATKVDLDKVYQSVARGGDGIQSLNAIKRSLKPDEWEAVAGNVIRNLGKATPGQQDAYGDAFSVNRFLTDWNRLGESRKVLFSGSEKLEKYGDNMQKIARAADRFKQAAQEMANPSGTGQFLANVGVISGGAGALGAGNLPAFGLILSGVATNSAASRLMTNPRFVQWLAKSTSVDSWPSHIAALGALAKSQGLEPEVSELLDLLKEQPQPKGQESSRLP